MGFAAARTEVREFKLATTPALAILNVYYSMTSCIATLSFSLILSNSSMNIA